MQSEHHRATLNPLLSRTHAHVHTRTHAQYAHTTLTHQTYVLKLAKSGSEGEKVFLLLESGSRFHTVQVGGGLMDCRERGGVWP